jgi:4-hydroxybenzoate polyprenyltransferase
MEKIMWYLPKEGFPKRMRIYLGEMYPVFPRLLAAALLTISFFSFLERIHGVPTMIFSPGTLVGIWSIFALLLILRLMDELKDREIDRELFHERPVPAGKVLESDIGFSLTVVIALYVVVNLCFGRVLWMSLGVLGYAFLMFKYFFIPRILRKHLLLNLTTHNPIIPIMLSYLVILFSIQYQIPWRNMRWDLIALLVAMYWSMSFAWEIARKVRSTEEENAYVTYSQIFGRTGAVLVAGSAQTMALVIGLYFYRTLSFSEVFLAILLTGYGLTLWGHVRFIFRPNPVTSKLKPFAERYILSVFIARIVQYIFFV